VAAVGLIGAVAAWAVGDVDTVRMLEMAFQALAVIFLRAGVKSAETSGLLAASGGRTWAGGESAGGEAGGSRGGLPAALVAGCVAAGLLTGCGVTKVGGAAKSKASMTPTGEIVAEYLGAAPTILMQDQTDAEGNPQGAQWVATPGIGGLVLFSPESNTIQAWTPGDMQLSGVQIVPEPAPGEPSFKIASLSVSITENARIQMEQFAAIVPELRGMTEAEALAYIEQKKVNGEITATVAAALTKAVIEGLVPLL
jgi:hypothetical protein